MSLAAEPLQPMEPMQTETWGDQFSWSKHPIRNTIQTASMAASAYHGYKRNHSVGWALWWGFMGAVFPVITPVIAVAQGFGKRKGSSR
jgi:hypothetical protein